MKFDTFNAQILGARIIPQVDPRIAKFLDLKDDQRSLLVFTTDGDDVGYISADQATKECDVKVVYGKSDYASSATTLNYLALAGDCIIIMAGPNPAEVKAAFAAVEHFHEEVKYVNCNDKGDIISLCYTMSRTGSYFPDIVDGLKEGDPMSYCIADPMVNAWAADLGCKAADVKLVDFDAGPCNTNYGSAFYTGSQSACKAAAQAYEQACFSFDNNFIMI